MNKNHKDKKSSQIQIFSFSIFLSLLIYYSIVIFHWEWIVDFAITYSVPFLAYSFLLIAPPIGLKSNFLRIGLVYGLQVSRKKAINTVIIISVNLCLFFSIIGSAIKVVSWMSALSVSSYWQYSHWFWVSLVLLIVFGLVGFQLWINEFISWKMLQDLKTIPITSPVFCFGAPFLWSKNLAYASLDSKLISTYSTLSIIAGIIFLVYLIVFSIFNHKFSEAETDKTKVIILDLNENPINDSSDNKYMRALLICFFILNLGLYIFLLVLIDALIHLF